MVENVAASKDSDHPITEDESFHEILGSDPGYRKGLGYGPPRLPAKGKERAHADPIELRVLSTRKINFIKLK
ncbi:unnamed protein product [Linum trigynum]|uniref:Uncharacterized protein n=1 Tax=Linum trigynum TaxID=586398 RepID=A0AAV2G696_9ROSI